VKHIDYVIIRIIWRSTPLGLLIAHQN